MKKFFVIGNPIKHSLSPKLHNFWIRQNNLEASYDQKLFNEKNFKELISDLRNSKINGANITVPFKKTIIPHLDNLSPAAKHVQSVNVVYKENDKIIGDNTDIEGFKLALKHINYNPIKKRVLILGAGGVVPSLIQSLLEMNVEEIILSNRTKKKAENLKNIFSKIKIIEWGELTDFDMIINATSVGLKKDDVINLDLRKIGSNKLFYDVIYNPEKTDFLMNGEKTNNQIENGKLMFLYQAQLSFKIWHNIVPKIDDEVIKLLKND